MDTTETRYYRETLVAGALHHRSDVTESVQHAFSNTSEMEETLKRQYQWRIDAFRKMFPWELGPDGSTCGGDRFCVSVMGSACELCSLLQDLDDEAKVWDAMKAALTAVVDELGPMLSVPRSLDDVRAALKLVEELPRYNQPTPEPHA